MNMLNSRPKTSVWRIAALIVALGIFLIYNFNVFNTKDSIYYTDPSTQLHRVSLTDNRLDQYFYADESVRALEFIFYVDSEPATSRIAVTLYNEKTDEQIGYVEQTVEFDRESERVRFEFPDIELSSITQYQFTLETLDKNTQVYVYANEGQYQDELLINQQKLDRRMVFEVKYANNLLLAYYWFFFILLSLALIILLFPQWFKFSVEGWFFLIAFVAGLAILFVNPYGQEPDGFDHLLRAFDLSYGNNIWEILGKASDRSIRVPQNYEQLNYSALKANLNQGLNRTVDYLNFTFALEKRDTVELVYKSAYAMWIYIPQAIGLYVGRLLAFNAINMISLARLLNLLAYIGMTGYAIYKMPVYKTLLLAIALMPMNIYQSASLSPDALIHSTTFLFVAVILDLYYNKPQIKYYHLIFPLFLLYLIYQGKAIYIFLGFLVLIIPFKRYPRPLKIFAHFSVWFGTVSVAALALFGFLTGRLKLDENVAIYENRMEFVTRNIIETIRIFTLTLDQNAMQNVDWLNTLGWLEYSLGVLIIAVPIFIAIVGVLDRDDKIQFSTLQKSVIWMTLILNVSALHIGLFIFDWINEIAAPLILGVQGRYFIPLFILPFLAMPFTIKIEKDQHFTARVAGWSAIFLTYTIFSLIKTIY